MLDLFAGTRGSHDAVYMIVGEAWGTSENRKKMPFVGASGIELSKILAEAKVDEKNCFFTNVINAQPPRNDMTHYFYSTAEAKEKKLSPTKGLYPKPELKEALEILWKQIEEVKPSIIIAFGNYALWALTEDSFNVTNQGGYKVPSGIVQYHGSQLYAENGTKLLPTFHPAAALRNWPWRYRIKHDLRVRLQRWREGDWDEPAREFLVRPNYQDAVETLTKLLVKLNQGPYKIAVDIETRYHHIACVGLAWNTVDAICIPLMCSEREEGYWSVEEEVAITNLLRNILTHPNIIIAGQNFLYDSQYFWFYFGVIPYIAEDTMIMHHLCFPGTPANLVHISNMYCHWHRYWKDDGKEWVKTMDEKLLWVYNCRDCVITYEASEALEQMIEYYKLDEQWYWQQRQLQSILRTMIRGVLIDQETKRKMSEDLEEVTKAYEEKLQELLPAVVYEQPPKVAPWYRSNKQQRYIFGELFGMKPYWNPKKKAFTMDDAALEYYAKVDPILAELCTTLQQYRSLTTFRTFTEMQLGIDGRMRTSYAPTTETFRWRSSEDVFGTGGNLQNLPKGQEE